jgi:cellulose biosynthesis protein BcsQ
MNNDNISYDVSYMRLNELADLTGVQPPNLTRHFKSRPVEETQKTGSKITGIVPGGVEAFLRARGFESIYRSGAYLTNSQCGGVSKTTTTITMAYCFSRLSDRSSFPIVILDLDSQASTTLQLLGWKSKRESQKIKSEVSTDSRRDRELQSKPRLPVITDYIEGRVKRIKDLLVPIGDNIWLIPSSLENSYLEKMVATPKKVKEVGEQVLLDIFEELSIDGRLKIFLDAPPALSPATHSFLYGINNLPEDCDKVLCIPVRTDDFGVNGCEIAIEEFEDMLRTFNTSLKTNIVPFLTFYDRRTSNSAEAMDLALGSETIQRYGLSKIIVRESAELAKKLSKNSHLFSQKGYKHHPVAQDYQDLVLSIMGWSKKP